VSGDQSGTVQPSFVEFVTLMALLTSLVALSIDAMLPALPVIGTSLGVADPNDNQYVITTFFFGFAVGQLFYGPISDSTGRKPAIYAGLVLFIIGGIISTLAPNFALMLFGRVLQGFGAAGPRTVTIAMIRDQYEGRAMARVMSFVMAIFIIIPVIAPTIGQGALMLAGWRSIFAVILALALICFVWLARRQPETLPSGSRTTLSVGGVARDMAEACKDRVVLSYIIAGGLIFGAFVSYLVTSQQIFDEVYGLADWFPLLFAALAVTIGLSTLTNAQMVMRFGMRALSTKALVIMAILSVAFLGVGFAYGGKPPLWQFMVYAMATFFCIGILFGNLMALAMRPLGHIAGSGAAVVGATTTLISLFLGGVIGQAFNGTILPLVGGFALLSIMSLLAMYWGNDTAPADEPAID